MDEYAYLKKIAIVDRRKGLLKKDDEIYDEFAFEFLDDLVDKLTRNKSKFLQRDIFKTNIKVQ
tara:strand:- start:21 stop:209 length:189 start_codon:yes stop_codon:yes gene_type:complete